MSDFELLSQQELLGLALDAFKREDSGHALAYLKEACGRPDASSLALFMLGSEYAQIGMVLEGKQALQRATAAAPPFPLARFQLGLLQLATGELDDARATWLPLEAMTRPDEQPYLRLFAQGLSKLAAGDEVEARSLLLRGIACNPDNVVLNKDMQAVIDRMSPACPSIDPSNPVTGPIQDQPPLVAEPPAAETAEQETAHLFISAYQHRGKPH